jgi:hypothetical protein
MARESLYSNAAAISSCSALGIRNLVASFLHPPQLLQQTLAPRQLERRRSIGLVGVHGHRNDAARTTAVPELAHALAAGPERELNLIGALV